MIEIADAARSDGPWLGDDDAPWPNQTNRRAHWRHYLRRDSLLELANGPVRCMILDISGSGASIECGARLEVGQRVMLQVPEIGPVPGVVRRVNDHGCALSFEFPPDRQESLATELHVLADLRRFL